jgi:hypothetical protein
MVKSNMPPERSSLATEGTQESPPQTLKASPLSAPTVQPNLPLELRSLATIGRAQKFGRTRYVLLHICIKTLDGNIDMTCIIPHAFLGFWPF